MFASNTSQPLFYYKRVPLSEAFTTSTSLLSYCEPLHLTGLLVTSFGVESHLNMQLGQTRGSASGRLFMFNCLPLCSHLSKFLQRAALHLNTERRPWQISAVISLCFLPALQMWYTLSFRSTRTPERTSTWHPMWNLTASNHSFWAECRVSEALLAQTPALRQTHLNNSTEMFGPMRQNTAPELSAVFYSSCWVDQRGKLHSEQQLWRF